MILYHGTCEYVARLILNDGVIKRATSERSCYNDAPGIFRTTYGYVYLTNDVEKAWRMGRKSLMVYSGKVDIPQEILKQCRVFEIDVNAKILEPDYDQCNVVFNNPLGTAQWDKDKEKCADCCVNNCLKTINCVRCSADIIVRDSVKRYRIYQNTGKMLEDWKTL